MYLITFVALLAEGVDRNPAVLANVSAADLSPSSRRAWIEIPQRSPAGLGHRVALLAEGVDRNRNIVVTEGNTNVVALLAEGVDRN